MILKEVYVYPDLVEFSQEVTGPFRDKSRHICSYLERLLQPLKFEAAGFKKICVIGRSSPAESCHVNTSGALVVPVRFDLNDYNALKDSDFSKYCVSLLRDGFGKCGQQFPIPEEVLIKGLMDLEGRGFKNEWIFKKKKFSQGKIECELVCNITMYEFSLRLLAYKDKKLVHDRVILETVPDEIVFSPRFKDVLIKEEDVVVLEKDGSELYRVPIEEMSLQ